MDVTNVVVACGEEASVVQAALSGDVVDLPVVGEPPPAVEFVHVASSGPAQTEPAAPRRKAYRSDLTDEQWEIIMPLIPPARHGGRPREVDMREVLNTIFYINRTGCQWDYLPHDLLPKSTVWDYYKQWKKDGTLQEFVDALRPRVREAAGREPTPSVVSIDSQTAKSTEIGGESRGYDGGKKIKGRKRHLLVDVMGLLVAVVVTAGNVDDGEAAAELVGKITPDNFPRLEQIHGDSKYRNHNFGRWLKEYRPDWTVVVNNKPEGSPGFVPVKIRWAVERTNAWNGRCRRHSKDYERTTESSEAMIRVSAIHLMLNRLAPKPNRPRFNYRMSTMVS